MSKMFLFVIGMLLWGAAYATPASILQYKIEPTETQKAEFFRKLREDPELYSYNPMHPGDFWVYEVDSGPGIEVGSLVVRVSSDTLINGYPHYKVFRRPGNDGSLWIKNEGDHVILYDELNIDSDVTTDYLIHENFTTTPGVPDTVYSNHGFGFAPTRIYGASLGFFNIFGEITEVWGISYSSVVWPPISRSVWWARKFGPIAFESDVGFYLIGASINGQLYGTVENSDQCNPAVEQIKTSCYPNPFNRQLNIVYDIKSSDLEQSRIDIFNLRGQLIFSDALKDTGSYTWNMSSSHQGKLAQGLYFYRLTTPTSKSKLVKYTLIR
ncbi:hypothetical protein MASR1M36_06340 [Candidatus Cloacimonadaceae bacterium]